MNSFLDKVFGDISGTYVSLMCCIGDRLDRVSFKQMDISKGFPPEEKYDLITTFDVIHDMTNPQAVLKSIHQALKPDGTYLWLEINSKDRLEDTLEQ